MAWWRADRPVLRFLFWYLVVVPLPIEFLIGKSQACIVLLLVGGAAFAAVVFVDAVEGLAFLTKGFRFPPAKRRLLVGMMVAAKRRFPELDETMHELWIQGLSTHDFEPSLRALLGETTPLSPSTISRVNKQFLDDYRAWSRADPRSVRVYLGRRHLSNAGAEDEHRVMLAVIGVRTEGVSEFFALEDAFGESTESRTTLFEGLRERRLKNVAMLVADGAQGIWKAFSAAYPRAKQQRCWLHKMRNVEDELPEKPQGDPSTPA